MRIVICLMVLLAMGVQEAEGQRRRVREKTRDRVVIIHERGRASSPLEFGVRGGYDFDEGVGSAGTQLRVPLAWQLLLVPSADVFFDESDAEWQLNGDLVVMPDALGGLYAGVGAGLVDVDEDGDGDGEVEAGYNLLVGLDADRVLSTRVKPFVEARWTDVGSYQPFRLVVGINVPLR